MTIDEWARRVPLRVSRSHAATPVAARFLLGTPRVVSAAATLPEGVRGWSSASHGKQTYLEAFESWQLPEPDDVLDLGCGDGFLTCFYGRLYPNARVVGLDRSSSSVAGARALATALDVGNLTFVQGRFEDLRETFSGSTFGLITSRCALRGLLCIHRVSAPGEPEYVTPAPIANDVIAGIRSLLHPRGLFISSERWTTALQLQTWANVLSSNGFAVDWGMSRGVRLGSGDTRALWSMLAIRVGPGASPTSLAEAETFLARLDLEDEEQPFTLSGHAARGLFARLEPRRLLFRYQAAHANDSGWRRELWDVGSLVVSFDYTAAGEHCELRVWSRRSEVSLRAILEEEAENLRVNQWKVVEHDEQTVVLSATLLLSKPMEDPEP